MLKVDERMKGATACLTTDAWSNIKNDSVVNYMAVSPACSLFLESVSTGQQGHDHKFIADDIARVIRRHEKTTFAGAVTDNTSTNKKAWKLLQEMFPSCYFQGCCSHGVHLLIKDVFGATKMKKRGSTEATYPFGYPFEVLHDFVDDCKDIVKFFHNHHVPKAQLCALQKTTKSRTLVRAAPTRWGTIQGMVASLLDSERHLHALVSARDFVQGTATQKAERTKLRETITKADFVDNLNKSLAILRPIDRLIVKYQSDKVPISDVMPDFHDLPNQFVMLCEELVITAEERDYLSALVRDRFQFMYGLAHGLSYLLDPALLGEGLPSENRRSLEDALICTPSDNGHPVDDECKEALYLQYTEFKILTASEKAKNTFRFQLLAKRKKSPLEWWLTDGNDFPDLKKIAIKLFSMATSSASSERNFSTMGFIHSKLRNSLAPQTVEKLVFIKSNIAAFYDTPVPNPDDIECSTSDSEDGSDSDQEE
jgi:hypothetical protein